MDRLTKRDIDGCLIHPWSFNGINGSYDIWDEELMEKQIDRLAAYEDFMDRWHLKSIEDAERIFRRVNDLGGTDLMAQYRELGSINHLRDLLQAEKDGPLSAQPCKVADKVYQTDGVRLYESTVRSVIFDTENVAFDEGAIGKTVFLTREEAEAAMAQKGGESDA